MNTAIFCTCADTPEYVRRVSEWSARMSGMFPGAELWCFLDGEVNGLPREVRTHVCGEPLGRASGAVNAGRKRSLGVAMHRLKDYDSLAYVESDVLMLRPDRFRDCLSRLGCFASRDERYGWIEGNVLVVNDRAVRRVIAEHYMSEAGQREDCTFESWLEKLGFDMSLKSVRAEGHKVDPARYDYICQVNGGGSVSRVLLVDHHCPGDTLEDTIAVRDLCASNPGLHVNVETTAQELWDNCAFLDRSVTKDSADKVLDLKMPLINSSNTNGLHVAQAIRAYLSSELDVRIDPGEARAAVTLSEEEMSEDYLKLITEEWDPARQHWLVTACGKKDFPCKEWAFDRFQQVTDATSDSIQWFQVGAAEHNHRPLSGVVNLLGKTTHRQLAALMWNSDGALSLESYLAHMATIGGKGHGSSWRRPCVVIAGGRVPSTFFRYPGQTWMHTEFDLPCGNGGCWKEKVDGKSREKKCPALVKLDTGQMLPKCMDMITADMVIAEIRRLSCRKDLK